MRTVIVASLRHHRRRYVASALAVLIGVAFIVAVNGLAGALRNGMTADVGRPFAGAGYVVDNPTPAEATKAVAALKAAGGSATTVWSGWTGGRSNGSGLSDLTVSTVADTPRFQWQTLTAGRMPERDGEALISKRASVARHLSIGQSLQIGGGAQAVTVRVVGIAHDTSYGGADVSLRPDDAEHTGALAISYVLADGARSAVPAGLSVYSHDAYVAKVQAGITRGVDIIAMLVSIFAAIALGVAILVITNTFAILFAQRTRDFALLRCVGVTRAQLRRSVRLEAFVLGLVSAVLGALVGVLVAVGAAGLLGLWVDTLGSAAFQPSWVIGAVVIGVAVTVAAAWLPTRAVTRITPLAALAPSGAISARSRVGVARLVGGVVTLLAGVGALCGIVAAARGPHPSTALLPAMFGAGALTFAGVLLVGPFLVPAVVKAAARLVTGGRRGMVGRLAAGNAVRNPRRTATTAASLMV
uniref:FtsX-like permease family protein n=1 Tax=Nocardioides sp. TaxID=35761 RepID=UPI00261A1E91